MNRTLRRAVLATSWLAVVALGAPAAHADESGSTAASVDVAVRSITVSPGTVKFGSCKSGDALTFPNDECTAGPITITNGSTQSHIYVRATDFEGSQGGTPWDLCYSEYTGKVPCTGAGGGVGVDQASLYEQGIGGVMPLDNQDACDINWDPVAIITDCNASPNESITVDLQLDGPESTTNASPTFASTITWTAMP